MWFVLGLGINFELKEGSILRSLGLGVLLRPLILVMTFPLLVLAEDDPDLAHCVLEPVLLAVLKEFVIAV